jgi:hypothetical protein
MSPQFAQASGSFEHPSGGRLGKPIDAVRFPAHILAPVNQLHYGDKLQVLREHIADASVDLIYPDPPFNPKRDYNLLFKVPGGHRSLTPNLYNHG